MKARAAAAATSPFAAGWRDPAFAASTQAPPPPPADLSPSDGSASKQLEEQAPDSPSQPPPPPALEKSAGDGEKDMQEKDMEKDDEYVPKDGDVGRAKEKADDKI